MLSPECLKAERKEKGTGNDLGRGGLPGPHKESLEIGTTPSFLSPPRSSTQHDPLKVACKEKSRRFKVTRFLSMLCGFAVGQELMRFLTAASACIGSRTSQLGPSIPQRERK